MILLAPMTVALYGLLLVTTILLSPGLPWGAQTCLLLVSLTLSFLWLGRRPPTSDEAPSFLRQPSLLWIVLAPGILAFLLSPGSQMAYHGLFMGAYVEQALQGSLPPENPALPGHPANTYWPYHSLLAALVGPTGLPFPLVNAGLNLACLCLCLEFSRRSAAILLPGKGPWVLALASLLILFGSNAFGGLTALTQGGLEPATFFQGSPRLNSLFGKFLDFSGFPMGLMFFSAALHLGLRFSSKRGDPRDLTFLALMVLGALALHPVTGLFLLLTLPVGLAAAGARDHLPHPKGWTPAFFLVGLLLLGFQVLQTSHGYGKGLRPDLPRGNDLRDLTASILPLLPFLVPTLRKAWGSRDPVGRFLCGLFLAGTLASLGIAIPDGNEYKFIYLSVVLASAASMPVLFEWLGTGGWRRGAALTLAVLVPLNLLLFGLSLFDHPRYKDHPYRYGGGKVHPDPAVKWIAPDLDFMDLYRWTAAHTPSRTLVIVPLAPKDRSLVGILSGRQAFVLDAGAFNNGSPEYHRRAGWVGTLYSEGTARTDKKRSLEDILSTLPERPKLVVAPHGPFPWRPLMGKEPAFQGTHADGYLFLPQGPGPGAPER